MNDLNKIDDWEFCYLSRKIMNSEKENNNQFENFVKHYYSYWMCAYIINLKGMKKVLDSGMKKNLLPSDEVLPILAHSSPHKDFYKFYNIQEPLNMYSLKRMVCFPEKDAFKKSDTAPA